MRQWQRLGICVLAGVNTTRFARRSGVNPEVEVVPNDILCSAGYPLEGRSDVSDLFVTFSARTFDARVECEQVAAGRPWRLRLQLLPDGRCGVAVNGRPVVLVDGGQPPVGAIRIARYGASYNTRIGVGRVRVFEGVLPDVDWTIVVR